MILFPAVDLQNGACVRLVRGDFSTATVYEPDPLLQAAHFAAAGAQWIHVVDLDGAQRGGLIQRPLIEKLAQKSGLSVQFGGGIRTHEDCATLFRAGIRRLVIGSLAVKEPETVKAWLEEWGGERIALALDVRLTPSGEPEVLTKGWQESSGLALWDVLQAYRSTGLQTLLCTDVGRDGLLTGTNNALYSVIRTLWSGLDVIAAGGVSSLDDLRELKALGLYGAIIGKALYEGRFSLQDAFSDA